MTVTFESDCHLSHLLATYSPIWYFYTVIAMMKSTGHYARDKSLSSEEPDEVKVSRPVLYWRRGG